MTLHLAQEHHDQRSDEWKEARLGRITASRVYDVIAKTAKGLPTAKYMDYAFQLAAERMTGQPTRTYTNDAMLWGIEQEAGLATAFVQVGDQVQAIHDGILLRFT